MGFDIFLLPEYITASMEKIMKKKIIIFVSGIVFLSLVGGGIAAYYFSYLPMKKETNTSFYTIVENYSKEYEKFVFQRKYHEALKVTENYRSFLIEKPGAVRAYLLFNAYFMENSVLHTLGKHQKIEENLRKMKRLLKTFKKNDYTEQQIMNAKLALVLSQIDFYHRNKEFSKALSHIKNFIAEYGSEEKIRENFTEDISYQIYVCMAKCLLKLEKFDKCKNYIEKVIALSTRSEDKRQYHIALLRMAELYLNWEKPEVALKYTQKAHEIYQSRRSYCYFAMAYYQQKKMEDAKKYYSLAIHCKKLPSVSDHSMKEFGKLLSE